MYIENKKLGGKKMEKIIQELISKLNELEILNLLNIEILEFKIPNKKIYILAKAEKEKISNFLNSKKRNRRIFKGKNWVRVTNEALTLDIYFEENP